MQRTILILTLILVGLVGMVSAQSTAAPAQAPATGQAPATAQAPTTPAAPDPVRMKAAADLIQAMNMEATFKESLDTMLRLQMEANPMLAQFEAIMREFIDKYLTWVEVKEDFVRLYADMFTEPELRELNVFYQTALGKKMLVAMPELMARSSDISQRRLQPHMSELQQKIMERVQQQQKQQPPQAPSPWTPAQGSQPGNAPPGNPAPENQPQGNPPSTPPPAKP